MVLLLTADNSPSGPSLQQTQDAIAEIQASSPTDAAALTTMLSSEDVLPGNTPTERLKVVLNATSNKDFRHFAIEFDDTGFKEELRDGYLWPSSDNQVGHFLTAVDVGYNQANTMGLIAVVGHELYGDKRPESTMAQIALGLFHPTERDLFTSGTEEGFQQILESGWGPPDTRPGNSVEDLRLSHLGWTMGKLYRQGYFTNFGSVRRWLREYIEE
jgi:hypothetical protein